MELMEIDTVSLTDSEDRIFTEECIVCGDNCSKKIPCADCWNGAECTVCGNCNSCIAPSQIFPYCENVFYLLVDTDKDMILSDYQELVNSLNNININFTEDEEATENILVKKISNININIHNIRNGPNYEYVDDPTSSFHCIRVYDKKTYVVLKNIYGSVLCGKLISGNTINALNGINIRGFCKIDDCKYVVEIEKKKLIPM